MVRTILVIDDVQSNRDIIKHILGSEYAFLEAADGREALDIMERSYEQISAVLLDLGMPVMDGFDVLEHMRSSKTLSLLPVIVTTGLTAVESEVKALKLGATDYISKPYNPIVIKQRIWNAIHLRETAATVNILRRDRLTGLYNREIFFEKIHELALAHEPGYYVMASLDINKFKVINDQYGTQKGDEVLTHIADIFSKGLNDCGGIFCRIASDDFAAFYPYSFLSSPEPASLRKKASTVEGLIAAVTFSIGRYRVDDLALSPSAMYDRATIACESIKGRYDTQIAVYDESMRNHLLLEQEIVTEMESALHGDQFEVWYQPQYNHATGALMGSEALVRWRHPQKGLVSPGLFIPVFEQNGFIYELDKYVWSTVCRNLRVWLDEGREALPVSVNISRYDLFRADIIDVITGLVKKYELPVTLLRLEITESAFAESTNEIVRIVKQFIDLGFTVEIDDFGSGYSSLNTLKSVPAQVVKLDMRFFEDSEDTQRSGNIVESVVRMTKWLGMSVIAEGVEQLEQADYLRSIGCNYLQGYLYAKPMPREEYEKHCANSKREKKLLTMETVENLDNGAFWNPKSMDTLIFNSYVGGACIFEYHNGKIEILRANRKYAKTIGGDDCTTEYVLSMEWAEHMDEAAAHATKQAIDAAIASGDDITYESAYYGLPGAKKTYLRTTYRLLAHTNDRYLLYSLNENITAQRAAEQREHEMAEEMRQIMENVDGGICAFSLNVDGSTKIIFGNEKFYALTGYIKEQAETHNPDIFTVIYPDDHDIVRNELAKLIETREPRRFEYRCVRRDGSIIYTRSNISVASLEGFGDNIVIAVNTDITEFHSAYERLKLLTDSIEGGLATYVCTRDSIRISYINEAFRKLFGYSRDEFDSLAAKDALFMVEKEDIPQIFTEVRALIFESKPMRHSFRVHTKSGELKWVNVRATLSGRRGDSYTINAVFFDITELMETNERLRLSEEENRLAIQHSKTVVCRYDVTSRLMSISPSVNHIFNLKPFIEDVPGGEVRNGHISPETAPVYIKFFEDISRGAKSGTAVYQRISGLGWRWIEAHSSTIFAADGKPASAVISFSDVTERLEKEAVYKKWQQALENKGLESYTLFRCNISKDGSFDVREGNLLQLVFDNSLQTFNERVLYFAEKCVYEQDQARYIAFLDSGELLAGYYRGKRADSMEFRQKLPGGELSWRRLSVELVEFPNSTDIEAYLMYEDINDAKLAEFAVKEQAETDPLTGILNRAAFAEAMENDIRAAKPGALHALLMLDIDGFKQVNDVFGHAAGDQTLIDIALILRGVLRHGDLVGRLGGDEFVIFLRDIESAEDAQNKARQICERGRRFLSAEVEISSSIGIALSPADGCDFETLYMKADRALYYVKGNGKDNYALYTDDMTEAHTACKAVSDGSTEPGTKKRRMLIVDDCGTDHAILTNIFAEDFVVENAKDGNMALSMMRHFGSSISVVLLDMVMPGMDGISVLKKMKQNAELKNIPVIVVSISNDRETCLKAIRAGASDFVTKPVDPELLRIRVELAISRANSERIDAKNSSLEYQNSELQRYKTVLSQNSTVVVEYDWVGNTFIYDDMISGYIAGSYDNRALWHIFLADFVADTATVRKIQELVHSVASGRQKANVSTLVLLKTPKGAQHWFRMSIYKLKGDFSSAARLFLAFTDLGAKPQEQ